MTLSLTKNKNQNYSPDFLFVCAMKNREGEENASHPHRLQIRFIQLIDPRHT